VTSPVSQTIQLGRKLRMTTLLSEADISALQSLHLNVMDHDLLALAHSTVAFIEHEDIRQLALDRPQVALALWRDTLIDASVFREWIMNVGRRDASERLSHLICEHESYGTR
jgi:hypothetical protein